jgi:hypothetical protein
MPSFFIRCMPVFEQIPILLACEKQRKRSFFLNAHWIKILILHPARTIAGNGTGLALGVWQRTLNFERSVADLRCLENRKADSPC